MSVRKSDKPVYSILPADCDKIVYSSLPANNAEALCTYDVVPSVTELQQNYDTVPSLQNAPYAAVPGNLYEPGVYKTAEMELKKGK